MGPDLYAGLDFAWMKELLAFDHWSMMTAGPLRDGPTQSFMEAPIPNFVTLQNWAKLRLLKGLHEGDLASASLEVRHLAMLCATTGTLVGDMIRLAILGIERGFSEEHQLPNAPALTQAEAQRLRGASFAAVDFLLPGVDPATRTKALKCLPNRCTALVEALGMSASLRELVPRRAPEVAPRSAAVRRAADRAGCAIAAGAPSAAARQRGDHPVREPPAPAVRRRSAVTAAHGPGLAGRGLPPARGSWWCGLHGVATRRRSPSR